MNSNAEKLSARRKMIKQILQLNSAEYRNLAEENRRNFDEEWGKEYPHEEWEPWAEIELYWTDVTGYAEQIAHNGFVDTPQKALNFLHKYGIFNRPGFPDWYFSEENDYPKLKAYTRSLDYLRLLVLEYLTLQMEDAD